MASVKNFQLIESDPEVARDRIQMPRVAENSILLQMGKVRSTIAAVLQTHYVFR